MRSRSARLRHIAVSLLLVPAAVSAALFKVGADAACQFDSIQAAIDAAAANGPSLDMVVVAVNQAYTAQALQIDGHDLWLRGGYASCADSAPAAGARTLLSGTGNGGQPVLRINMAGTRRGLVTVFDVELTGGQADAGGGMIATGNLQLGLGGVWVHDNLAGNGGGVYLAGQAAGEPLVVQTEPSTAGNATLIEHNHAQRGGGIYVADATSVSLGGARIAGNTAGYGGGIHVGGALAQAYGSMPTDGSSGAGIHANEADIDGGGVYVTDAARFYVSRHPGDRAYEIAGNRAGHDGGGVYADANALVTLTKARVHGNVAGTLATGHGGGLHARGGASVLLTGGAPDDGDDRACLHALPCAALLDNSADHGGAAYAAAGGHVSLAFTEISGNHADAGALLTASGAQAAMTVGSSLVHGNSASGALLQVDSDGRTDLTGSTLVDNAVASVLDLAATQSYIGASILHQPATPILLAHGGVALDLLCVISSSEFGSGVSGDVRVVDPQFVAAAAGDYRLAPGSPAIDACAPFTGYFRDYALRERGFDQPTVADNGGPYDIGAWEMPDFDLIFAWGFE